MVRPQRHSSAEHGESTDQYGENSSLHTRPPSLQSKLFGGRIISFSIKDRHDVTSARADPTHSADCDAPSNARQSRSTLLDFRMLAGTQQQPHNRRAVDETGR